MKKNVLCMLTLGSLLAVLTACTPGTPAVYNASSSAPSDAGEGLNFAGTGASSVPTGPAVVSRLTNGLQGNASPLTGNFAKSLKQVSTNLPRVTDPSKASGYDQVELLVYAACTDLTSGGTNSAMQSKYGVTATGAIASNQTALVNAGVKMLDQYVAGLASQGPTSAQVTASFTALLTDISSQSGSTSTIAFVAVCIAANTAGSTLMSF
jgi:hypothetical protein